MSFEKCICAAVFPVPLVPNNLGSVAYHALVDEVQILGNETTVTTSSGGISFYSKTSGPGTSSGVANNEVLSITGLTPGTEYTFGISSHFDCTGLGTNTTSATDYDYTACTGQQFGIFEVFHSKQYATSFLPVFQYPVN